MIDTVFATDMAIHFDLLKNFNEKIDAEPDVNKWEDRNLLYQMVVHLADIGNPARPFPLARGWAERVIQEFCEQVRASCMGAWPLISAWCRRMAWENDTAAVPARVKRGKYLFGSG